ncbi:hypothetical protein M5X17_27455 [Paenibacillus alvei]|uniref:hypothetical protein n=1 Tax=Paenibacillus alvei TaxID=44250 RepID=UPI002281A939|nr:hypothetical protein [Paenibacillus alvei]MCY9737442.1 hypothetical protein [Paenibacillus alvei]
MPKYGLKEVADITFYDLATNEPVLFLDTLKMTTVENKADSASARGGKGNPKLLTWDFNRESTVKMQDALMSMTSIAMMTGNAVKEGEREIYKREQLIAAAGAQGKAKLTLAEKAVGGVTIFLNHDESTKLTIDKADVKNATDVEVDEKDLPVGTPVTVFYIFKSDAKTRTITISADKFPSYVKVVGDTVIRNASTGKDEPFQMVIHKAKISPNFTFTFQADGDPTVFDMDLEVFRRDEDTEMIELIKY